MDDSPDAVTRLLQAVHDGNREAENQLLELMYRELRRVAGRYMRNERPNHTLQPTALINEAYARLLGPKAATWDNRRHFLACAAGTMRHILVDYARARRADKRGGDQVHVPLDGLMSGADKPRNDLEERAAQQTDELLATHEALTELAAVDQELAKIIDLGVVGLSEQEIATEMGMSKRTVERHRKLARIWIRHYIDGTGP